MVIIGATKLRSPSQMTATARIVVRITAMRGSVALPRRRPRARGTAPSLAMASRVRGAARMLPRAEESVDAQTPIRMRKGQRAILCMIMLSPMRSVMLPWPASQTAVPR